MDAVSSDATPASGTIKFIARSGWTGRAALDSSSPSPRYQPKHNRCQDLSTHPGDIMKSRQCADRAIIWVLCRCRRNWKGKEMEGKGRVEKLPYLLPLYPMVRHTHSSANTLELLLAPSLPSNKFRVSYLTISRVELKIER